MSETEGVFQKRITDMAHSFGWKVWHVPAPMRWDPVKKAWVPAREGAGLPDLILLHDDPPRLVFMEIKRKGGKLTDKQQEFLQAAKTVAEAPLQTRPGWVGIDSLSEMVERTIGVFAAWPEDEGRIEQMLRSRVVA